jgi:hypothetical protein
VVAGSVIQAGGPRVGDPCATVIILKSSSSLLFSYCSYSKDKRANPGSLLKSDALFLLNESVSHIFLAFSFLLLFYYTLNLSLSSVFQWLIIENKVLSSFGLSEDGYSNSVIK